MKQKLRWKRFIVFSLALLPVFLLFDVVADLTKGRVQWDEIWAMKNMFFKVLAALVGGYFASTFKDADDQNKADKRDEA